MLSAKELAAIRERVEEIHRKAFSPVGPRTPSTEDLTAALIDRHFLFEEVLRLLALDAAARKMLKTYDAAQSENAYAPYDEYARERRMYQRSTKNQDHFIALEAYRQLAKET